MLILTRKAKESLKIGDVVTVTVLAVKGHQVRIGIEAPVSIPVHREEVHARIVAAGATSLFTSSRSSAAPAQALPIHDPA